MSLSRSLSKDFSKKSHNYFVGLVRKLPIIIMNNTENHPTFFYSEKEERLNVLSHGYAFLCSIVCFILLLAKGISDGSPIYIFSLAVFGVALMLTFITSTIYHKSKDPIKRNKYRMLDMFAIYTMIAGSYTPYALVLLQGTKGWILFSIVWSIALFGIICKLFTVRKNNLISTFLYIGMGGICVF